MVDLDANLSLMDFRLYDGALGRFAGIDILADLYQSHSPYHFGYNNPISFADPTGLHSEPRPDNYLEILDNGDVALFYTNEDGDLAAIFFINRTRESQSNKIKEFGINLSQYAAVAAEAKVVQLVAMAVAMAAVVALVVEVQMEQVMVIIIFLMMILILCKITHQIF